MIRRRDFLRLGGAACWGTAGCGIGSGGTAAWTPRQLERADGVARGHGGRGWAAWRGGVRVMGWESGYEGPVLSITKAVAGLAATRALGEGWLDDGEAVAATISEWRGDGRKRRITVRMLLQQTAGLEAGGGPLEKFLQLGVMRPIGLGSPRWRADGRGRFFLSTGAELSVEELGRLGRTLGRLLRGEDADGFDAAAFARVTRPSAVNPMFGGGIWRNGSARRAGAVAVEVEGSLDPPRPASFWRNACLSRRHPPGLAALIGSSGRRVFVWPEGGRVVARLGVSPSWRDGSFLDALA